MNESTKEHTTNTVLLRIIRRRISHSVRSLLLYVVPSAGNRRVLKPTVILQLNVCWRSPYHRNMHENPLAQVLCSQTSFVQVKVKPHRRYSYQPSKRNADRVFVFYVVGCFYLLMWNRLCVSVCVRLCVCVFHMFHFSFFTSSFRVLAWITTWFEAGNSNALQSKQPIYVKKPPIAYAYRPTK